jgi:hypothetical protein
MFVYIFVKGKAQWVKSQWVMDILEMKACMPFPTPLILGLPPTPTPTPTHSALRSQKKFKYA